MVRAAHLLLALLNLLAAAAGADSYTQIPGTRVLLVVPQDFEVATDFAGIIRRDASASVHVVELPAPAEQAQATFTKPQLASKGMALLRSEKVDTSIGQAALLHVSQSAQGIEFRKWMLVGGNATESVLLTATVPATLGEELEAPLRQVLLTARWEPERRVDPREGVGFSVAETDDLKIANSLMGSALVLTRGGVQTTTSPADPFVVVARSTAEVAISDLSVFSKRRLAETARISNPAVEQEEEIVLASMPGHELVASAVAEGSVAVFVYQAIAFDGHHYFLIQGRAGEDMRDEYLDQFRAVARSLSTAP